MFGDCVVIYTYIYVVSVYIDWTGMGKWAKVHFNYTHPLQVHGRHRNQKPVLKVGTAVNSRFR